MSHGDLSSFNAHHGFPEALVRGYRAGFLNDTEYQHLDQCETIDDLKANLTETEYGNFLQNEASPISPSTLRLRAQQKLCQEFEFMRASSVDPLTTFLDFIRYDYMIDNMIMLLRGTLNNPDVDVNELIEQCHPMGMFDEGVMRSVAAFENTGQGYADLYETVLIDTPVGKYFAEFLRSQTVATGAGMEVRTLLEEVALPVLEHSVRKLYLEDFYRFCVQLGGETATMMGEVLRSRADATTIMITLNSMSGPLNEEHNLKDRAALYPAFGTLYEAGLSSVSNARTEEALGRALEPHAHYRELWAQYASSDSKSLVDLFYEREVMLMENSLESQSHFGCFYAFVKLREQEIRNLGWIAECIVQRMHSHIGDHLVRIFSMQSPWRNR